MSRGYDGAEIDDFRDPEWEPDRPHASRDRSRGSGADWQTRTSVRLRLQKVREAESNSDRAIPQNPDHLGDSRSSLSREGRQEETLKERDRSQYEDRGTRYSLLPSEIHTLTEVAKFRVVGVEDLARLAYNGDREQMQSDLRNLTRQGLAEPRATSPLKKESRQVVTLTERGENLIRRYGFVPGDQAIYSGLMKPKEAEHDADLYRVYHKAAEEIERKGGKVLGVQLDYELKEKLYQRLGRAQAQGQGETQKLKETCARDLQLPVVRGKVSLPDLRIEYATQENEIARVDLELATRHYHAGHIAEKARVGFQLYARPQDTAGLRRVRDEHEITAAILSL